MMTTTTMMTNGTMTTTEPAGRARRVPLRLRIVTWFVGTVAGAFVLLLGTAWGSLQASLANDANNDIVQEIQEFRQFVDLASERGDPVADTPRVVEEFVSQQRPADGELLLGLVPATRDVFQNPGPSTRQDVVADPAMLERLATEASGIADTPAGEIRWGRIDVVTSGGEASMVVVVFTGLLSGAIRETFALMMPIALFALAVTGVLAWLIAGRLLEPVRSVQRTAAEISERDLTRRLPVTGDDELADLAVTFNAMLDRLEEAFAAEQRFVDDAGHELRTPITIIRGHLELMGDDPDERRATVALVTRELDRMSRIVSDLLTLAKADRPDYIQLAGPVDVGELTLDLDAGLSAIQNRRWLVDEVADGLAVVDRQRISQAVLQLASNAVRHTRDGDTIRLASRFTSIGGTPRVEFTVADTGPGVPDQDKKRIFDRFHRGASHGRDVEGTDGGAGLGLAIVRAIATGHGGTVAVTDTPGGGATFVLSVPTRIGTDVRHPFEEDDADRPTIPTTRQQAPEEHA